MSVTRGKIIKSSGEEEEFSAAKLIESVERAGADEALAEHILNTVEAEKDQLQSSEDIHRHVFKQLQQVSIPVADRYNLKRSIMNLGPSGFPFEQFLAELFRADGYEVMTNQILRGKCVAHEVDLVMSKADINIIVEVKFHNKPGLKSDLKIPLYVKSRYEDLKYEITPDGEKKVRFHECWLVTNTKFSKDAVTYGECADLRLISWDYPRGKNLAEMIDKLGLHPLTALSKLTTEEQVALLNRGIVLCRQIKEKTEELSTLGITAERIAEIVEEAEAVANLQPMFYNTTKN